MRNHSKLHPENQCVLGWVIESLEKAQDDNAFAEVSFKIKAGRADDFYFEDQRKASLAVKR